MNVWEGIGLAIPGLIFGFLLLNSGSASREGSYRRGEGWYLDVSTPRETLMRGSYGENPQERTGTWIIRVYAVAGILFGIGAVVAAIAVGVFLASLLGLYAILAMGLGSDGLRRNRRADRAAQDDEGTSTG